MRYLTLPLFCATVLFLGCDNSSSSNKSDGNVTLQEAKRAWSAFNGASSIYMFNSFSQNPDTTSTTQQSNTYPCTLSGEVTFSGLPLLYSIHYNACKNDEKSIYNGEVDVRLDANSTQGTDFYSTSNYSIDINNLLSILDVNMTVTFSPTLYSFRYDGTMRAQSKLYNLDAIYRYDNFNSSFNAQTQSYSYDNATFEVEDTIHSCINGKYTLNSLTPITPTSGTYTINSATFENVDIHTVKIHIADKSYTFNTSELNAAILCQ